MSKPTRFSPCDKINGDRESQVETYVKNTPLFCDKMNGVTKAKPGRDIC